MAYRDLKALYHTSSYGQLVVEETLLFLYWTNVEALTIPARSRDSSDDKTKIQIHFHYASPDADAMLSVLHVLRINQCFIQETPCGLSLLPKMTTTRDRYHPRLFQFSDLWTSLFIYFLDDAIDFLPPPNLLPVPLHILL